MVIADIVIVGWIGIPNDRKKQAIVDDFLAGGLEGLCHMTDKEISDTMASYAERTDGLFPIFLSPIHKMRLRSLVLWTRDRRRAGQAIEFPDGTTEDDFKTKIEESLLCENRRSARKKIGESYLATTFNSKLKGQAQWEGFEDKLKLTLGLILGVDGVPLSYVIRENDEPEFDETVPFDEAVIKAAKLTGENFKFDAHIVHQLILKNLSEDSDAYTYIRPHLKHQNGRLDIKALRDRYSNNAAKQAIINSAKATLETICYTTERSFSFEKFRSKLQGAYDVLEANGRAVDNKDIVDGLWRKIQSSELQQYIQALKSDYQKHPRDYKLLLQHIAIKVAAQGGRQVSSYTSAGECPAFGAHTRDGSLYIGNYIADKWNSDSVRPHHREILQARSQDDGGGKNKSKKRSAKEIKRNNEKLQKLQKKIAAT
eukprot:scaffold9646_cov133-Cylindrotheca_fusiformis.AAC.7